MEERQRADVERVLRRWIDSPPDDWLEEAVERVDAWARADHAEAPATGPDDLLGDIKPSLDHERDFRAHVEASFSLGASALDGLMNDLLRLDLFASGGLLGG